MKHYLNLVCLSCGLISDDFDSIFKKISAGEGLDQIPESFMTIL